VQVGYSVVTYCFTYSGALLASLHSTPARINAVRCGSAGYAAPLVYVNAGLFFVLCLCIPHFAVCTLHFKPQQDKPLHMPCKIQTLVGAEPCLDVTGMCTQDSPTPRGTDAAHVSVCHRHFTFLFCCISGRAAQVAIAPKFQACLNCGASCAATLCCSTLAVCMYEACTACCTYCCSYT